MIVNIGLFMAFFSALPFLLVQFGLEEKSVWAISSTLIAVLSLLASPFIIRNMSLARETWPTRIWFASFPIMGLILIVLNILNALGIIFDQQIGPFLAAVAFYLALVCYNFSRLLMQPLWKMVRQREAMSSTEG